MRAKVSRWRSRSSASAPARRVRPRRDRSLARRAPRRRRQLRQGRCAVIAADDQFDEPKWQHFTMLGLTADDSERLLACETVRAMKLYRMSASSTRRGRARCSSAPSGQASSRQRPHPCRRRRPSSLKVVDDAPPGPPRWRRMPALVELILSRAAEPWVDLRLGQDVIVSVRAGGIPIVMGSTGAGKTSLVAGILIEHARNRGPVIVLSRELPADELAARAIGIQHESWPNVLKGKVLRAGHRARARSAADARARSQGRYDRRPPRRDPRGEGRASRRARARRGRLHPDPRLRSARGEGASPTSSRSSMTSPATSAWWCWRSCRCLAPHRAQPRTARPSAPTRPTAARSRPRSSAWRRSRCRSAWSASSAPTERAPWISTSAAAWVVATASSRCRSAVARRWCVAGGAARAAAEVKAERAVDNDGKKQRAAELAMLAAAERATEPQSREDVQAVATGSNDIKRGSHGGAARPWGAGRGRGRSRARGSGRCGRRRRRRRPDRAGGFDCRPTAAPTAARRH